MMPRAPYFLSARSFNEGDAMNKHYDLPFLFLLLAVFLSVAGCSAAAPVPNQDGGGGIQPQAPSILDIG
jgi:hypothetical protein